MPLYLTQDDLQTAVGLDELLQATDRDHDGEPDTAVVNYAIDAGEGRAHQKLGRRYKLPLDWTDIVLAGFLKPILVDFAWEACFVRADMVPADLLTRNTAHEKTLDDIMNGVSDLPASNPPPIASTDSKILWSSQGRCFNSLP